MLKSVKTADRMALASSGIVLAILLFLSFNLWSSLTLDDYKLDLTAEGAFTLSETTETLLASIEEPITMRLYLSSELLEENPHISTHAARVREILARYEDLSSGMIRFIEIDPQPYSREEDRANSFGLETLPLSSGRAAFFGLVGTNSTDDYKIIGVLDPGQADSLEYELTEMIYRLANPDRPIVGVIDTLGATGTRENGYRNWVIMGHLRRNFDIQPIENINQDWPDDMDALMIIHPRWLDQEALYRIEQFALSGGGIMVFTDPHAQVQAEAVPLIDRLRLETSSNFETLYHPWGLRTVIRSETDEDGTEHHPQIAGDMTGALIRQEMTRGRVVQAPFPFWMELRQNRGNFDATSPITGNLQNMISFFPGALEPVSGAETTFEPLVFTSGNAMLFDRDDVYFLAQYEDLNRQFEATGIPYTLAAKISGPAMATIERPDGFESEKDHISETENLRIIAVADVDLLTDSSWAQQQGPIIRAVSGNADFVANALESLTGIEGLAALRSGGMERRGFERIEAMQLEASELARQRQRELENSISAINNEIQTIVSQATPGQQIIQISEEDSARLNALEEERAQKERALRDVSENFDRGIETLKTRLTLANVLAVPICLLIFAGMGVLARIRQRRAYAQLRQEME